MAVERLAIEDPLEGMDLVHQSRVSARGNGAPGVNSFASIPWKPVSLLGQESMAESREGNLIVKISERS